MTDHYTPPTDAPRWLLDNLTQPGRSQTALMEGKKVHFLSWHLEDTSRPALVLVHGFGGHAHWWSFLAPFFTDRYRVIAIDLPGMGDSAHLDTYSADCMVQAILGVIRHCGLSAVTLVGHSFGGIQSTYAMAMAPELFQHGIVIDCNLQYILEQPPSFNSGRPEHARRASREECMARFKLTPPQPEAVDALMHYVGYHSCTHDEAGWYWKFDPKVRDIGALFDPQRFTDIPLEVDCIFGQNSVYNTEQLPQLAQRIFPRLGELIILPDAYHHIMLDHPLELVETIKRLLA